MAETLDDLAECWKANQKALRQLSPEHLTLVVVHKDARKVLLAARQDADFTSWAA